MTKSDVKRLALLDIVLQQRLLNFGGELKAEQFLIPHVNSLSSGSVVGMVGLLFRQEPLRMKNCYKFVLLCDPSQSRINNLMGRIVCKATHDEPI